MHIFGTAEFVINMPETIAIKKEETRLYIYYFGLKKLFSPASNCIRVHSLSSINFSKYLVHLSHQLRLWHFQFAFKTSLIMTNLLFFTQNRSEKFVVVMNVDVRNENRRTSLKTMLPLLPSKMLLRLRTNKLKSLLPFVLLLPPKPRMSTKTLNKINQETLAVHLNNKVLWYGALKQLKTRDSIEFKVNKCLLWYNCF